MGFIGLITLEEMTMNTYEAIKTYTNTDDGIEAIIADGNDKFAYRVILRDTDADASIQIMYTNTYMRAEKYALEFINGVCLAS